MIIVWLRNAGDAEDDCWVVCAKGDPGAVEFTQQLIAEKSRNAKASEMSPDFSAVDACRAVDVNQINLTPRSPCQGRGLKL